MYSPEAYIAVPPDPSLSNSAGQYDYITSLSPTL
jgi:hypothetical protein